MDHVALGTSMHCVAWFYVALGTMSLDHILPLGSPVYPRTPQNFTNTWNIHSFCIFYGKLCHLQELHTKSTKSLHKFHEHPFFINCKKLCRYRNTVSTTFKNQPFEECSAVTVPWMDELVLGEYSCLTTLQIEQHDSRNQNFMVSDDYNFTVSSKYKQQCQKQKFEI